MSGVTCPACGQVITYGKVGTECGGDGEGCCAATAYAFDLHEGRAATWEGEGAPPSPDLCTATVLAHETAAERATGKDVR